jgi:hypothetical protein
MYMGLRLFKLWRNPFLFIIHCSYVIDSVDKMYYLL